MARVWQILPYIVEAIFNGERTRVPLKDYISTKLDTLLFYSLIILRPTDF